MKKVQAGRPHYKLGGDRLFLPLHRIRGAAFGKAVKKQQVRRSFTPDGPVLLAL
jgi:hypothetical protein